MDNRVLDIEGWMSPTEIEWLQQTVRKQSSDALIVELGAWKGRSTAAIVTVANRSTTCVTVDTWLGQEDLRTNAHSEVITNDIFLEFLFNMKKFNIHPEWYSKQKGGLYYLRMESSLAPILFEDNSIDMLFIDCDHRKFGEDIDSWYSKVKNHGIISGHDYQWEGAQVEIDKRVKVEAVVGDIWWGYKG